MFLKKRIFVNLFLVLGFSIYELNGQQIQIVDIETNLPVAFASIVLYDLTAQTEFQLISDTLGFFALPGKNTFSIHIKALSYKDYRDTISGSANQKIFLEQSNINIDRVIVTGRLKPQLADKSIYKVNVINNGFFVLNAINDLGAALSSSLGFQYRSEGVLGDFIRIQGLTGEHIQILIDGIPVTGRSGGMIDLNQINLYNADHIEIIEGPMSVVYGSNSMAVINIITKQHVQEFFSANIASYYESVGRYNLHSNISISNKKHAAGGYLARNFNSGWSPEKNMRFKYYKPKVQYAGGLTYQWFTNRFNFTLKSDMLFEELRDPDSVHLSTVYNEQLDTNYITYLATDYFHYTTRINNRLNYKRILNADTWIGFQLGHSYYKKQKDSYNKDLVTLQKWLVNNTSFFDTSYYHSFLTKMSAYTEKLDNAEIQAGLDYSYEQSKSKRIMGRQNISDFAAYVNLLYKVAKSFHVQPGIRLIYNSAFKAPVIYSLNVLYAPGQFQFRASYSNSFRAPSVKELYFQFIDNNHYIIGNPGLLAENGYNFTFNGLYRLSLPQISFTPQITIFHNSIENAIQLALDITRPGWGYYVNIPSAKYKTQGYRLQADFTFLNTLNLNTGISTTGRSALDGNGQFAYSTDIASGLTYTFKKYKFSMNILYKYIAPYYNFVGTFDENLELSGILEQRFASYHTMDIIFNKNFAGNRFLASTGIKNLFDVNLIDTKGTINVHGGGDNTTLAGYGRSYFFRLSYRLNKNDK